MKISMSLKVIVAAVAALAMAPTLMATLITFDDLPGFESGIPNGYNGLNWGNFFYLNGDAVGPSGYQNGVVSHSNVAFNGGGGGATFSSNNPFNFNSVYLTGAWNDGLHIEVQGFIGANLFYDQTVIVNTSGPSFFNFNYLGVTEVTFISSFGVHHAGYGGAGEHFAMDNLTINASVPDAGSTLSLLSFASLGLVALRRKLRC